MLLVWISWNSVILKTLLSLVFTSFSIHELSHFRVLPEILWLGLVVVWRSLAQIVELGSVVWIVNVRWRRVGKFRCIAKREHLLLDRQRMILITAILDLILVFH